jgi:hypothetical protein
MKSLFPEKYHNYIYLFSLTLLVVGLPLSKFLMSLSQIILICNWILGGDLKNKCLAFWKNKSALILSSLLLLHFIGLIYTSDLAYGIKDIRIKIPLFILPLIISTSKPLSQKLFDGILQLFVAAIIVATAISTLILVGVIHRTVVDTRDISIFISHIRFALLICVAVFVSAYFIYNSRALWTKIMWAGIALWLIIFLILMESLTGLVALYITTFLLIIYATVKSKNKKIKYGGLTLLIISIILISCTIALMVNENNKKDTIDFTNIERFTSHGNPYEHDVHAKVTENGHFIWMYCCKEELEGSWNKRSAIKIGDKDLRGNSIYFTLIRFLTSKGLRKDADAVALLSDEEVKAIERGVPNVNYQSISSLSGRIHETLWEIDLYEKTGNANGHSLTQRFEYWKTALGIIKNNLLFGVGTGDVPMAFEQAYEKNNSSLKKEWRLRSHNQYLSIAVAFGIIGLLWFLITLVYPLMHEKRGFNFLYFTFFIVAIISFFTEDTLETQAGVTFYAFLNSFFLFSKEKKN